MEKLLLSVYLLDEGKKMKIELHEVPIQEIVRYSKHLNECQGYEDKIEQSAGGRIDKLINVNEIQQGGN